MLIADEVLFLSARHGLISANEGRIRVLFGSRLQYFFRRRRPDCARTLVDIVIKTIESASSTQGFDRPGVGHTVLAAARNVENEPAATDAECEQPNESFNFACLEPEDRLLIVDYLSTDRQGLAARHRLSDAELRRRVVRCVKHMSSSCYLYGGEPQAEKASQPEGGQAASRATV